ncbi:MAG: hypothetical protein R3A80_08715 [Bdellovibrionota bacterium]
MNSKFKSLSIILVGTFAISMSHADGLKEHMENMANHDCKKYSKIATDIVSDGSTVVWELKWASTICTTYGLEALKIARKFDSYYEWQFKAACLVDNPYALDLFKKIVRRSHYQWELEALKNVKNKIAYDACQIIRQDSHYEWQLSAASRINTEREFNAFKKLVRYGYNSYEIEEVANLDD